MVAGPVTVIGMYVPICCIFNRTNDEFIDCRKQLSYKRPNFWKGPVDVLCCNSSVRKMK